MLHAVKKVEYVKDYKLKLTFRNQEVKIVDLEKELWGQMFEPLKDIEYFKKVKTDGHTIVWPNGADFCPDVLYEMGKSVEKIEKKPLGLSKRTTGIRSLPAKPKKRTVANHKH